MKTKTIKITVTVTLELDVHPDNYEDGVFDNNDAIIEMEKECFYLSEFMHHAGHDVIDLKVEVLNPVQ